MKVWVSKYTYCCRTPKQINETPMADLRHRVGGPPQVFHQLVWVYGGKMGASTPTVSYNSPPMWRHTPQPQSVDLLLAGGPQCETRLQTPGKYTARSRRTGGSVAAYLIPTYSSRGTLHTKCLGLPLDRYMERPTSCSHCYELINEWRK